MTTLDTITVGQFQEIYKINKSEIDPEEKMTEMVSVLAEKTVQEVDTMTVPDFNKLSSEIVKILSNPLPETKPSRTISGFPIVYEPAKLSRGQYVTIVHFMKQDVIENCHYILASLTYNEKTGRHESEKHKEIAEKMQDAKLTEVYPATVFFCQLFRASMQSLQSFFLKAMMTKGMKAKEAQKLMAGLMKGLDGFTTASR